MRSNTPALTLLALGAAIPAPAQVQSGELLISFIGNSTCDALRHYRSGGTLVIEARIGAGYEWSGAAITREGNWVTTYRGPQRRIAIFDPAGTELTSFPAPELLLPGDVAVFADGTLAVADLSERVELYSQAGVHLGAITAPGLQRSWGLLVDQRDELWVSESNWNVGRIWRFARDGTLLGSFDTSRAMGDLDAAPDGTVWAIERDTGRVRRYTRGGQELETFPTLAAPNAHGIAVAPDGSLWVAGTSDNEAYHYVDQTLAAQFPIPCNAWFLTMPKDTVGTRYCSPAALNSSGLPGRASARGSLLVGANDVTLVCEDLPVGEFGYFLVGSNQGTFQPPGSQGTICLACSGFSGCAGIGRYNRSGEIFQGPAGSVAIDLGALPLTPPRAVMVGETWNFQAWYRDLGSNNFTDAVSVTFR